MPSTFEDYVEEANRAGSVDELFDVLMKELRRHGLDRATFALLSSHADIGADPGVGIVHNYPADWMAYYSQYGFDQIDPVVVHACRHVGVFEWADLPTKLALTRKQRLCLELGEEAGLYNGVCSSFRGPRNEMAGFGLATSERRDAFSGNLDVVNAVCNHFYIAYRRLHQAEDDRDDDVHLTAREREILTWAAIGKTDAEIGEILAVSVHAVDFHMRNIRRKLNAHSRILAVVKAISSGLIAP